MSMSASGDLSLAGAHSCGGNSSELPDWAAAIGYNVEKTGRRCDFKPGLSPQPLPHPAALQSAELQMVLLELLVLPKKLFDLNQAQSIRSKSSLTPCTHCQGRYINVPSSAQHEISSARLYL